MNPTAHSDLTLPSRRSMLGSVAMWVATAVSGQAQDLDRPVAVGSASLDVQFLAGGFDLTQDEIRAWVASCAQAVAGYLGAFPVRQHESRSTLRTGLGVSAAAGVGATAERGAG